MDWVQVIVLALLQGITGFLPALIAGFVFKD